MKRVDSRKRASVRWLVHGVLVVAVAAVTFHGCRTIRGASGPAKAGRKPATTTFVT